MSATSAPRRRPATAALLTVLAVVAGVLAAAPAHAGGAKTMDAAITRKLDSPKLETTSAAARCLESQVAATVRSGRKPTSAILQKACGLKSVTVASVPGRGTAARVAIAVRAKPAMAAALQDSGHLSVTVRGGRPAKRRVVVAVGAAAVPRDNDMPEARFWSDVTYGVVDEDPVQVALTDASEDSDGSIASRTWVVTAPDGSQVPVQPSGDDGTFATLNAGVHTVTLTVTDDKGATDTYTETVDPLDPLSAERKVALEQSILDNTNAQRALYGADPLSKAPLAALPCLGANARAHAVSMARAGDLFHQLPTAVTAACPESNPGWGENVLWRMDQFNGPALVQQWMDSPGHRYNILSPFTHMGVGVHFDRANGRLYAVQVFYRLTPSP